MKKLSLTTSSSSNNNNNNSSNNTNSSQPPQSPSSGLPNPNELYLPAITRLRRSIYFKLVDSSERILLNRKDKKNETYSQAPLTARNIETLRCERLGIQAEKNDEVSLKGEEEEREDRENACNELRRKREVQIPEWIRKLP
jgi:hypothetical protein